MVHTNILHAAQKLHEQGHKVIPCYLNKITGKKPPCEGFGKYVKSPKEINDKEVYEYLKRNKCLISIFSYTKDGFHSLDIDTKNAKTPQEKEACQALANEAAKYNLYVEKSVNGGFHIFWNCKEGNAPTFKGRAYKLCQYQGKENKGYVVVAPSQGYEVTNGIEAEFPIVDKSIHTAFLDAVKEILKPYSPIVEKRIKAPAKPLKKPVNQDTESTPEFKRNAEILLSEACSSFASMKDNRQNSNGKSRHDIITHFCNKIGVMSAPALSLDYCIQELINARNQNEDKNKLSKQIELIQAYTTNAYNEKRTANYGVKNRGGNETNNNGLTTTQAVQLTTTNNGNSIESWYANLDNDSQAFQFDLEGQRKQKPHYSIKKYLSDCPNIKKDIIDKIERGIREIALQSAAGSGKSTVMIKELMPDLIDKGYAVVMCVPFRNQIAQTEGSEQILVLSDKITPDKSNPHFGYISTYDKAFIALNQVESMYKIGQIKGWILIIDESHLLTEQYSIRSRAINTITVKTDKFEGLKSTLEITATPDLIAAQNKELIIVESEQAPKLNLQVDIYSEGTKRRNAQYFVLKSMLDKHTSGAIVVRLNHKSLQRVLALALIKNGCVRENEIYYYYSEKERGRKTETAQIIEGNQTLPKNARVIFATSIFDQAINIKKSAIAGVIYCPILVTDFNERTIVQLYNRFRDVESIDMRFLIKENRINRHEDYKTAYNFRDSIEYAAKESAKELNKESLNNEQQIKTRDIDVNEFFNTARISKKHYQGGELCYKNDNGHYTPNSNAINAKTFEFSSRTKSIKDIINEANKFIPKGKFNANANKIESCIGCPELEFAANEIKNSDKELRAIILNEFIGHESDILKFIAATTNNPQLKNEIIDLGFEATLTNIDIIERQEQDISRDKAVSIATEYCELHVFFAKYGVSKEQSLSLVRSTDDEVKYLKKMFLLMVAFCAFDYVRNIDIDIAKNIILENSGASKVFRIYNAIKSKSQDLEESQTQRVDNKISETKELIKQAKKEGKALKRLNDKLKKQKEARKNIKRKLKTIKVKVSDIIEADNSLNIREIDYFFQYVLECEETPASESKNGKEYLFTDIRNITMKSIVMNFFNVSDTEAEGIKQSLELKLENLSLKNKEAEIEDAPF